MIDVYVPATSANCCVGFDCLGMALDWWAHFHFEKRDVLQIEGCPTKFQNEQNLVVQAFYKTCDYLKKAYPVFKLVIDSDIPFARGLGSSSTCVVAGILACDAWFDAGLNKMDILNIATSIEGHPDNVAPAIFGQATTCFIQEDKVRMSVVQCAPYHCLVMIPDYEVKTAKARKLLPSSLDFQDCIKQVGHALGFIQALQQGNEMILSYACHDILHEPYRKKLIHEYDDIKDYCTKHQIPMWISGSGSCMLAISLDETKLIDLAMYAEPLKCKFLTIAKKGAYVKYE